MANLKVPFEAGMAVRKALKNSVSIICDYYDVKWELKEYKSFWESQFLLKAEGTVEEIKKLQEHLMKYFDYLSEGIQEDDE